MSEVSESEIRAQLAQILESETFVRSERLTAFLRFIVERALEGNGATLKEQVLVSELYGRGPDFDTRLDPVVRVDARRLRDKLREYYAEHPEDLIVVPANSDHIGRLGVATHSSMSVWALTHGAHHFTFRFVP